MDTSQQNALQKHAENLAQLITRLSTFFEGANPSIDNELQKLRGHLAGRPNFTLAEVSIQKLNPLLMDGNKQIRHQIKENVSSLQSQIKKLQQADDTDKKLQRPITQLLATLSLPTASLNELFSHFFHALNLVEKAIHQVSDDQPYNAYKKATDKKNEDSISVKLEILNELQQLIEVYSKKKPDDPQINELKETLDNGVNDNQLLESCLIIIRLIVSETMLDASANGKVVQSIVNTLDNTSQHVNQSISLSQEQHARQDSEYSLLQDMLGELDANIDEQKDIDELKEKAKRYIEKINHEVDDHHSANKHDQTKLMSLLVDMQTQLNKLQRQTQNYKKRLVEQKASLYTDPLTRVPNRLAYNERALKAMEFANSQKETLAIAIIDVDHFKRINDQYGHSAGDRTLQVIARHLKKNMRPNEFIARWGGEEFVLLMQNQDIDDLQNRLEEMRHSLSEIPFKFKQTPVKITASFGACIYQSSESLQQFFERADSALYTAKKQGRNRVIVINEKE